MLVVPHWNKNKRKLSFGKRSCIYETNSIRCFSGIAAIVDENGDLSDADSQRRRKRIQRIQKDFSKLKLNEKPTKNHDLHFYYNEKKILLLENLIDTAYPKHSICGIQLKNEMQMRRVYMLKI